MSFDRPIRRAKRTFVPYAALLILVFTVVAGAVALTLNTSRATATGSAMVPAYDAFWQQSWDGGMLAYPMKVSDRTAADHWQVDFRTPDSGAAVAAAAAIAFTETVRSGRLEFEYEDAPGEGWLNTTAAVFAATLDLPGGAQRHAVGMSIAVAYRFSDGNGDVIWVDGRPLADATDQLVFLSEHAGRAEAVAAAEALVAELADLYDGPQPPPIVEDEFPPHNCQPGHVCTPCITHCGAAAARNAFTFQNLYEKFVIDFLVKGCLGIDIPEGIDITIELLRKYKIRLDIIRACSEGLENALKSYLLDAMLDFVHCILQCNPPGVIKMTATCEPPPRVPLGNGTPNAPSTPGTPGGGSPGSGEPPPGGSTLPGGNTSSQTGPPLKSRGLIELHNPVRYGLLRDAIAAEWGVQIHSEGASVSLQPAGPAGLYQAALITRPPEEGDVDPAYPGQVPPGYTGWVPGGRFNEAASTVLYDVNDPAAGLAPHHPLPADLVTALQAEGYTDVGASLVAGTLTSPGGGATAVIGIRLDMASAAGATSGAVFFGSERSLAEAVETVNGMASVLGGGLNACVLACHGPGIIKAAECIVDMLKDLVDRRCALLAYPFNVICVLGNLAWDMLDCIGDIYQLYQTGEKCVDTSCPQYGQPRIVIYPNPNCPIHVIPIPTTPVPIPSATTPPPPPPSPPPWTPMPPPPGSPFACPELVKIEPDLVKRCQKMAACAPEGAAIPGCPSHIKGEGNNCFSSSSAFATLPCLPGVVCYRSSCHSGGCLCQLGVPEACEQMKTACFERDNCMACLELAALGNPEAIAKVSDPGFACGGLYCPGP